jgi:hypothetical protein
MTVKCNFRRHIFQFIAVVLLCAVYCSLLTVHCFAQIRNIASSGYDVVALRVEFQPDTTRYTTGDGTFNDQIWKGLTAKIDPLPHNSGYFQAHLDFLNDYVKRVSDGKTELRTHLIPEVIRLSKPMGAYSPTGAKPDAAEERAKLVAMIREAWTAASSKGTLNTAGFDPNKTAFLLFHAGAGRDLELVGTSLDKTPEDIPSLYFSAKDLQGITFKNLPVNTTAVLPETESRVGYNYILREKFLQELSINGLLAASFFNFLGVPDLFNTASSEGQTAIGAFCLMDFEGFFAYRGLMPPEPSAWVKYYLGWIEPQRLTTASEVGLKLRAASSLGSSDAYLVPISASEYFLVENRFRDPEGDGLKLKVWQNGVVTSQSISNQDAKFTRLNPESFLGGVLVSADNYDWALPGGVDKNKVERNGGILIWHVDERVVADNLATNRINGNPKRRGVALVEAGTAQDIGFVSHTCDVKDDEDIFSGTVDDYWYKSNPQNCALDSNLKSVGRYENQFTPFSTPTTQSNMGGFSGISLLNFSDASANMTLDYKREGGKEAVQVYGGKGFTQTTFGVGGGIKPHYLRGTFLDKIFYVYSGEGNETAYTSFIERQKSKGGVALVENFYQRTNHMPASSKLGVCVTSYSRTGDYLRQDYPFCPFYLLDIDYSQFPNYEGFGNYLAKSPLILMQVYDFVNNNYFNRQVSLWGNKAEGRYFDMKGSFNLVSGERYTELWGNLDADNPILSIAKAEGEKLGIVGKRSAKIEGASTQWTYNLAANAEVGQAVFGKDRGGVVGIIPEIKNGQLKWLLPQNRTVDISLANYATSGTLNRFPVLADVDADGLLDVICIYGENLLAFNQSGALLEPFPIRLSATSEAQPLVAKFTGDTRYSIFVASTDGAVYAYDLSKRGAIHAEFPLPVGKKILATPLLFDKTLYAVSEEGDLRAWQLPNLGEVWWGELYYNGENQSYVELNTPAPTVSTTELLISRETYNYPNPVKNGVTNLRFACTADCEIRIAIADISGNLIKEFDPIGAYASMPSEIQWQASVASGVYLARISATANGKTETKLVKIGVIK